jgi:DNA-binding transcriptional regulator YiaG
MAAVQEQSDQEMLARLRELASARQHPLPPPDERRRIRRGAGISEAELAAALGCSTTSLNYYETGLRTPRGRRRDLYVAALEVLSEVVE